MTFRTSALVVGGAGILAVGLGVFVPSIFGFSSVDVKDYSVKLVPQGTSGVLKVDKDNKCKKGKHKGCLLFEVDEIGLIKFYLPGSKDKIKNCSNANKVITKVEITTTGMGGDSEAEKGDYDRTNPLPVWAKTEAFTNVNRNTGIVYHATKDNAFTQVLLVNLNSSNEADGEKHFWYRVTATDCETPANTWVSDPRGDNEGTHF